MILGSRGSSLDSAQGTRRSVELQDVMLRDGLQNEDRVLPTERKIELVERLAASGLGRIEVSSFVSPRAMSQLADADAVFKGMARRPGEFTRRSSRIFAGWSGPSMAERMKRTW